MKLQDTESMTKSDGMTNHDLDVAQQSLGLSGSDSATSLNAKPGAAVRSVLLKKRDAEIEQRIKTEIEKRIERMKLKGKSPTAGNDPANQKKLEERLRLHKSAANTKVPFPRVPDLVLSGTALPPFDVTQTKTLGFSVVTPVKGDPVMSATTSPSGQISASIITGIYDGLNDGRVLAMVGFRFSPPGPGLLRIWACPTYSFSWEINSNDSEESFDVGNISLAILDEVGEEVVAENFVTIYDKNWDGKQQESEVSIPLQVWYQAVYPRTQYLCIVYLDVAAFASWPESLAYSMMAATVPSINYEFVELLPA